MHLSPSSFTLAFLITAAENFMKFPMTYKSERKREKMREREREREREEFYTFIYIIVNK